MSKKYSINGVDVSYEVFHQVVDDGINPDNFHDLRNIDAPDIPQIHKDRYTVDRWNESKGRGKTLWTPRRRMVDSIQHKEKQLAEKKAKRQASRRAKLDAWGARRALNESYNNERTTRNAYYTRQAQAQEADDNKSVKWMALIFGVAFLLMCIGAVITTRLGQ